MTTMKKTWNNTEKYGAFCWKKPLQSQKTCKGRNVIGGILNSIENAANTRFYYVLHSVRYIAFQNRFIFFVVFFSNSTSRTFRLKTRL